MGERGHHGQQLGKLGEDLACRHLESIGHTILERNYRSGHLEIDIISFDADGIHFVEVKARQLNIQAPPQDNVDRTKQGKLAKAALKYLNTSPKLPHKNAECFFDVVAVTFNGDEAKVDWFPQAFIPLYI